MRRLARLTLGLGLLLGSVLPAAGHWVTPEQVVALLRSDAVRREYAVRSAVRSGAQPRLLVVSVGPDWPRIDAARRRAAAERWRREWRESVPSGLIAIVDAGSQRSLVSFDARGHARLRALRETGASGPREAGASGDGSGAAPPSR